MKTLQKIVQRPYDTLYDSADVREAHKSAFISFSETFQCYSFDSESEL